MSGSSSPAVWSRPSPDRSAVEGGSERRSLGGPGREAAGAGARSGGPKAIAGLKATGGEGRRVQGPDPPFPSGAA